jgi:hypothetical protein
MIRFNWRGAITGVVSGLFVAALIGCTQALSAIGPGVTFAVCVLNVYTNEPAGTPMVQVIADELKTCSGDATSIISILDASEPAALHKTVAHGKPAP